MSAAAYPIRRNTALLALCLFTLSGVLQLAVAVATITLVLVTGIESILGLGPAIFLTAGALAALPAGRLMDRIGRIPVIAGAFALGAAGCATRHGGGLGLAPGPGIALEGRAGAAAQDALQPARDPGSRGRPRVSARRAGRCA